MFSMRLEGFDELQRAFKRVEKAIEGIDGENKVPFDEIFPPAFIRKYTDFEDIGAMIDASGHDVQSPEDFRAIPDDEWEKLIKARTRFESWAGMQMEATKYWAGKKIERAWEGS